MAAATPENEVPIPSSMKFNNGIENSYVFTSNVIYLGASRVDPLVFDDAILALQDVLGKHMVKDNSALVGHPAQVLLTCDGLQILYLDTNRAQVFLPLKYLIYCGAFRKITKVANSGNLKQLQMPFKTLNQIAQNEIASDPPLIAVVFKGIDNFIAHILAMTDNEQALRLVNTMMHCYYEKEYSASNEYFINRSFNNDPNVDANDSQPNISLSPNSIFNLGKNVNAASIFKQKTVKSNIKSQKIEEHNGYLVDDSSRHQQPTVTAPINDNDTRQLNNFLSHHLNPFNKRASNNNFAPIMTQHQNEPMASLKNINQGIYKTNGTAHNFPLQQRQFNEEQLKNFRITYADGQEITPAEISSDPNLRSIISCLKATDNDLDTNEMTQYSTNNYGQNEYTQYTIPKKSNEHMTYHLRQGHSHQLHGHHISSPKQNVIIRWLRHSESNLGDNPVLVKEEIRQVNPGEVNDIIKDYTHSETNRTKEMYKTKCVRHDSHYVGVDSESPKTVIIERWLPPPQICTTKKKKPSKLLIPIMVNETKLVKPKPVIIEHMQPIFRTRRRVKECHTMTPLTYRRC